MGERRGGEGALAGIANLNCQTTTRHHPMSRARPVRAAFRLTQAEYDHLLRFASQRGWSFSDLCRVAIQRFEAQQSDNAHA